MIYSLSVENFYSIGDKQEFVFTTSKPVDNSVATTNFGFVNKINCIVGNNASGKTNMLKSIVFFKWLAVDSFTKIKMNEKILFKPHALLKDKPTKMEMIFSSDKKLFKLYFEFNNFCVLKEKLSYRDSKMSKFKSLYVVDRENENFKTRYFKPMNSLNSNERLRLLEKKNSTLFSYFITTGALTNIGIKDLFTNFFTNLVEFGGVNQPAIIDCFEISELLESNEKLRQAVLEVIKTFDVGITGISTHKSKLVLSGPDDNQVLNKDLISFVHGNESTSFAIPLPYESEGTLKSASLLTPLLTLISDGGILIVDEIEMSKHPTIVRQLISNLEWLTKDNPEVQLIFTTHQPLLLEDRSKSQIFLTDKSDCINTEVYRLDDISGVRNDENFALKYLSGRYGAVPRGEVSLG